MAKDRTRPRLWITTFTAFATLVVVLLLAQGCQSDNALVGGQCAPGYVACGGACAVTCDDGGSTRHLDVDGSARDGGDGGDDGEDGDYDDDGGQEDPLDGGPGRDACPPPPYTSPAACGACGIVCVAPTSACLQNGVGQWVCALPCTPPLVACGGRCVDLDDDPLNCGACGKICPSNICVGGVCQGSTPGDVVIIGHDYQNARANTSQAKVLSNAMFIPTSNPLRVLSYEQYAEATNVAKVKALVAGSANGRTLTYTVANTPALLQSANLAKNYDVILLYDQSRAAAGALASIGASWATHLDAFAKAGGVIVALDGAAGSGEMPALVTSAGLLDVAGHTTIAEGTQVTIVAPSDRVGSSVVSPYAVVNRSVTLQSNQPNGGNVVFVARERVGASVGDPIVIHRIVP